MSHESTGHGTHDESHPIHLPDPSFWPLVVGAAALLAGLALVWWSRDRGNDLAGPLLGAALVAVLVASGGWAYEDGRMKRKAEQGVVTEPRSARYTQVVTFAIAAGRLTAARSAAGVLQAIEASDLRDLQGFQDMRIVVSPAETGPSQALVETTWSGREGLATYEETRQTILDVVTAHPDEVLAGTVQVFDMEVVKDTKDTSFKFGLGAAATVLVALAAGGFALGAGLTAFQSETTAGADGGITPVPQDPGTIVATDNKFDRASITLPPNEQVTLTLKNDGKAPHNLHFLDRQGGQDLAEGSVGNILQGGQSEQLTFTTPGPGAYFFQCDVHPDQMTGTLTVQEGAPNPSGGGAPGGTAAGSTAGAQSLVATDNKFDKKELTGTAGQEFTLDFKNNGKAKHNVHVYDKKGGEDLAPGAAGEMLDGGQSETVKFTPPKAGTFYFQCDVHPDQMFGNFVVK